MLNLVILILTFSNVCLVHGGDVNSLVDLVCEGTPKPYDCHQCLDGAPADTDKKGLAFRSITCSLAANFIVSMDFERTSLGSDDPREKNACALCSQIIGVEAAKNLQTARSFLNGGGSVAAAKQLSAASDKWLDCSVLFPNLYLQPFFPDLLRLGNLYVDTKAILNDL